MSNVRWLLGVLKEVRWAFTLCVVTWIIEAAFSIAITGAQKWVIDDVFYAGNFGLLFPVVGAYVAAVLLFNLFHLIAYTYRTENQLNVQRVVVGEVMESVYRMPVSRYQNERIAAMMNYMTRDADGIAAIIAHTVPGGLQVLFTLIALSWIIGSASPLLLVMILSVTVAYVALGRYFAPRLRQAARETEQTASDLSVTVEEGLSSTREVIAFNRIAWERARYDGSFRQYFARVMAEGKLENKQRFLASPLRWGVNLLVLGYGGYGVIHGSISLGLFVVVYQFASQFVGGCNTFYNLATRLVAQMAHVERVREFIESQQGDEGHLRLRGPVTEIRFDRVTFRYGDDQPIVLDELSLDIPVGSKVAFVGSSGGGKSTIAQLLIRFFNPKSGRIVINGAPLSDYVEDDWLERVAIVFQDPYLFPDTIRNNLLLGREHITEEAMIEACRKMCIHEFIAALPEGYDTEIGERGLKLSGGQRQRLALARTILADREILILDEATSALDLETERQVQSALDELRKGRTTIIIAHRLSTIQNADVIYVLENGHLAELGTHDELMQGAGVYHALVSAQAAMEESAS